MRETTIFRSSRVAVALAVLAMAAGTASAQDTLQAGAPAPAPRVHVVSQGETLWSLAGQYLGDPLLWPEIYRLNTLVVEDPHWIFPGEELQLGPGGMTVLAQEPVGGAEPVEPMPGDTAAPEEAPPEAPEVPETPEAPPPPPPSTDAPTVFRARQARPEDIFSGTGALRYRAVSSGEFYSAGFLTEGQDLPWARVTGVVGRPAIKNVTASSSALLFGEVEVAPPSGAAYRGGDSLLIVRIDRGVLGWGGVVVPTGIARVTEVGDNRVLAEVVTQFGRVSDGQRALPIEPFHAPGTVVPVPVDNGMEGKIIAQRDENPLPNEQDIMFLDLGREDGVVLGDMFEVVRPLKAGADDAIRWDRLAVLRIVHVRDRSSSGQVVGIHDFGTKAGLKVRLIRKMPS